MSEASLHIARLEHALREARDAIARLEDERLRLARRNELLVEVLTALREGQTAASAALIEQALGFDGQPWSLPELTDGDGQDEDDEQNEDDERP
jgi:hypothetical protein